MMSCLSFLFVCISLSSFSYFFPLKLFLFESLNGGLHKPFLSRCVGWQLNYVCIFAYVSRHCDLDLDPCHFLFEKGHKQYTCYSSLVGHCFKIRVNC